MLINPGFPGRLVVLVVVAVTLAVVAARFMLFGDGRLKSLPADHGRPSGSPNPSIRPASSKETEFPEWNPALPRVTCAGPRGLNVNDGADESIHESAIDIGE